MPKDGSQTREKILDAAHELMLQQGYTATSIDQLLAKTGLTKGTFFYHFKNKAELAMALINRYAAAEHAFMYAGVERAERFSRDPVQQVLLLIGFAIEVFEDLDEPHPGCLFASYCYQNEIFTEQAREVITSSMLEWRRILAEKLNAAAELHPPRVHIDMETVADMFLTLFEGAFILVKALQDNRVIVQQLQNYRNYIELLFGVEA